MSPRTSYLEYHEGVPVYVCPHCRQEFEELYQVKKHLEREHGGFSAQDVEAARPPRSVDAGGMGPGESGGAPPAPAPRKVSRKSRELNEKLNECMALIAKRIMSGLNDTERERLGQLKGELLINALGFDFDFDQGLIPLKSKFWLVTMLLFTQAEVAIPEGVGAQIVAILKARQKPEKSESEEAKPTQ